MPPLFNFLRFRPHDHEPEGDPNAGLPPPTLSTLPKAQGKPKRKFHSNSSRGKSSSAGVKVNDSKCPQAGRQRNQDVEAQQSQPQPSSGTEMRTPLRVHWARFKKRITGSAVSDSLMDPVDSVSVSAPSLRQRGQEPDLATHMAEGTDAEKRWQNVQEKSSQNGRVRVDEEPVDEIVVENVLLNDERAGSNTHTASHSPSETAHQNSGTTGAPGTTRSVSESVSTFSRWDTFVLLSILRWRIFPAIYGFFRQDFWDEASERGYRKEMWYNNKALAFYSGLFFVFDWILACAIAPRPWSVADIIFYPTAGLFCTIPIPFYVAYDWPRSRPMLWQVYISFCTAIWGLYQLLFMYLCGFYSSLRVLDCQGRDFLALFYYMIALQVVAMFGLRLGRFMAMLVGCSFIVLSALSIVPYRSSWVKNILNFMSFEAFILYMHYKRETSQRRLYSLREQLKVQFRATQKAQVSERKEASSKRRLTSYIFHEVRVPLNTASLAVQNMRAGSAIGKDLEQDLEFTALEGSLSMMSKVLNDVLDFNRMDSGRFESVSTPYSFHTVMRSMFVPLRLAADARGLELVTKLDPRIDEVSRHAAYQAQGYDETWIRERISCEDDETGGLVVGDEMRLRQILTNLASNACKFTQPGGRLEVSTTLVYPPYPMSHDPTATSSVTANASTAHQPLALSVSRLSAHNSIQSANDHRHGPKEKTATLEKIVVHIEVTDTGVGIRPQDLVDLRLFSPYVQTEIGRHQGGKGTGLGLALVRHIVMLSGGRLGVKSKLGCGSTFWVELPLGVGKGAVNFPLKPVVDNEHPSLSSTCISDMDLPLRTPRSSEGTPFVATSGREVAGRTSLPSTHPTSPLEAISEQGASVPVLSHAADAKIRCLDAGPDAPSPSVPATLETPSFHKRSSDTVGSDAASQPALPAFTSFFSPSTLPTLNDKPPAAPAAENLHPLRVLVVDDDPLTRTLMSRLFVRLGCHVSTAENGLLALEQIMATPSPTSLSTTAEDGGLTLEAAWAEEDARYSVVFLDNQMPVMSGLGTTRHLREAGRQDLVVGVTGNALISDQKEYLEAGADHVLTKPVKESSLKTMLEAAQERRIKRLDAAMKLSG